MKYLSVCSGIEAATVAWHGLGWEPVAFSEIEPFPSAVLAHHYPDVPNLGDMTKYHDWTTGPIELLVGGTPCQAFSVAGLRGGLSDARGNLSLTFCKMADHFDPEWALWENVPGVLSSKDNAFGCFLAGLCGAGEPLVAERGWANAGLVSGPRRTVTWRILDAQYFGVAQRRRRVFVLAVRGPGNWAAARALFPVGEGLFWDSPPRREAGERVAACLSASPSSSGSPNVGSGQGTVVEACGTLTARKWPADLAPTLNAAFDSKHGLEDQHALGGAGLFVPVMMSSGQANASVSTDLAGALDCLHEAPIVAAPIAFPANLSGTQCATTENLSPSMGAKNPTAVALQDVRGLDKAQNGRGRNDSGLAYTVDTHATQGVAAATDLYNTAMQVRRLTPVECERLQGFPDRYTEIPWRKKPASECPDGPRYKALGNSMAVPVMRWIGERIQLTLDSAASGR